jgi:hypothetical protein
LTIGSGLGGTSYNGSTGVTITNTGVTSIVAGTNIAVSGATGAVTVSVTGTVPTATTATNQSGGTVSATTGDFSGLLVGASSASTNVNTANDAGSFSARGNSTTVASMSFHRTGAYAINMGLGTDNVFRIGGWSASNDAFLLTGSGALTLLSTVTAPTFVGALTGAATTAATVTSAAQPNITSVGTLSSVTVSGNVTAGNVITSGSGGNITGANVVSATTISTSQILNSGSNLVGNIGNSTTWFNTVFARAIQAYYADLAEAYAADGEYAPGTVLVFGGSNEVTISNTPGDARIAGVVSTNPAHVMNAGLNVPNVAVVALTGRVPTSVVGTVRKGDMMVSAGNGAAQACATPAMGTVIGKALENFTGESGIIEVVVGRL